MIYKQIVSKGSSNLWVCRRNHMVWHSNESYWVVLSCVTVYYTGRSRFLKVCEPSPLVSVAIYKPFFNNIIKVHQDTAGHPCNRKSFFFCKRSRGRACALIAVKLYHKFTYLSSVMLILLVFREHQNGVKKKNEKLYFVSVSQYLTWRTVTRCECEGVFWLAGAVKKVCVNNLLEKDKEISWILDF